MLIGWRTDLLLKCCSKHSLNIFVSAIETELTKSYVIYWLFLSGIVLSLTQLVSSIQFTMQSFTQGAWKFFGGLKGEGCCGSGRMIRKNCSYRWRKSWPCPACNFSVYVVAQFSPSPGLHPPPPPPPPSLNLYLWVWYCGIIMSYEFETKENISQA